MSFAHSQNPIIYDSSFTDVHGDFIHYGNSNNYSTHNTSVHISEPGLQLLLRATSEGAAYDSQERYPPPKCHPGTREEVLADIQSWIAADALGPGICWLHGPAGAGKSAIAQTISETCAGRRQLAGSFFFSRSVSDRNNINRLFTTIAFQICLTSQENQRRITKVLNDDPLILHRAVGNHLRLITEQYEPMNYEAPIVGVSPFLVVIDGLDECENNTNQSLVISYIQDLVHTRQLPLRFLIVSRPEPHIRHAFNDPVLRSITREISVYGDHQAEHDVYTYLRSEFDRMCESERHRYSMRSVSRPWPSDDDVRLLARRSGGYFIYGSTVIKYTDEEYSSCIKRLNDVLGASQSGSSPFCELDKLYRQILSTCPDIGLLTRILGYILLHNHLPQTHLDIFLSLYTGETMSTLRGLHSILKFNDWGGGKIHVHPFHTSFQDFIFDVDRAGPYFIDVGKIEKDMVHSSLHLIKRWSTLKESVKEDAFDLIDFTVLTDNTHGRWLVENIGSVNPDDWLPWVLDCQKAHGQNYHRKVSVMEMLSRIIPQLERSTLSQDFIENFINLHDLALQCHLAPKNLVEVQCIQDIFAILATKWLDHRRGCLTTDIIQNLTTLLKISGPLDGKFYSFICYLTDISIMGTDFRDGLSWLAISSSKIEHPPIGCRLLYYDPAVGNPHVAHCCIEYLKCPNNDDMLIYAHTYWAHHLSLSPPSNERLISDLRNPDFNFHVPRTFWDEDKFLRGSVHNAGIVIEWLKKMSDPPRDILALWETRSDKARITLGGSTTCQNFVDEIR